MICSLLAPLYFSAVFQFRRYSAATSKSFLSSFWTTFLMSRSLLMAYLILRNTLWHFERASSSDSFIWDINFCLGERCCCVEGGVSRIAWLAVPRRHPSPICSIKTRSPCREKYCRILMSHILGFHPNGLEQIIWMKVCLRICRPFSYNNNNNIQIMVHMNNKIKVI